MKRIKIPAHPPTQSQYPIFLTAIEQSGKSKCIVFQDINRQLYSLLHGRPLLYKQEHSMHDTLLYPQDILSFLTMLLLQSLLSGYQRYKSLERLDI